MNFARNAILSAIIFQLIHPSFSVGIQEARADDKPKATEAQVKIVSSDHFVKSVTQGHRDLQKAGCIDTHGNSVYRVIIKQEDIPNDDGKAASCIHGVMNQIEAEKEVDEMLKEQNSNNNCSNCAAPEQPIENVRDFQASIESKLNESKSCTDEERAIVAQEAKTCSLGCGINNAMIASLNTQKDVVLGAVGSLVAAPWLAVLATTVNGRKTIKDSAKSIFKSTDLKQNTGPNCPIAQGSTIDCIGDILKTFGLSMLQMATGIWNGIGAKADSAASWAGGLFGLHKKAEATSTEAMLPKAKMTDDQVNEMNKDKGTGFLNTIKNGLVSLFDFFVVDTKEIGEEFQCYRCRDRLKPACKVIGLLGRDAVVAYLGGKAIDRILPLIKKVAVKLGKSAASGGRAVFNATEKAAAKRAGTRKLFQKGLNLAGRVSDNVAEDYATMKASAPIRFAKTSFKKAVEMPSKLIMASKRATNDLVNRIVEHDNIINRVLKKTKTAISGVMQPSSKALTEASEVVVSAAAAGGAEAIAKAESSLAKMRADSIKVGKQKIHDVRRHTTGENNLSHLDIQHLDSAVEVRIEYAEAPVPAVANRSAKIRNLKNTSLPEESRVLLIRDESGEVIHRVDVPTGKTLSKVSTFDPKLGDGKVYPILEFKDGSTLIRSSQGEIRVPVESQHVVKEAMGLEIKGIDTKVLLDQEIKANMDRASINYHETIGANGEKELKIEPQKPCEMEMGLVNAGRAL